MHWHAYFLVKIQAGVAYLRNPHVFGYGDLNRGQGLLAIAVNEIPELFNGATIFPVK